MRPSTGRTTGDRGSSDALGLALVAPAAIALALVILFVGRSVDGRATAQSAAESAAQAAAQERTRGAAVASAQQVATAMLVDHDSCSSPTVYVDTSGFAPGGVVSVSVSCTPSAAGLEPIGARPVPWTAVAHATIDPLRAGEGAP